MEGFWVCRGALTRFWVIGVEGEDGGAVGGVEREVLRTREVGWEIRRLEDEQLQRCILSVGIAVGLLYVDSTLGRR